MFVLQLLVAQLYSQKKITIKITHSKDTVKNKKTSLFIKQGGNYQTKKLS